MEKINQKQKISLKEIFPDGPRGGEAHDWTPSLFNNEQGILDELIKVTKVQIDPLEMEYIVWDKLRIDILANNGDTGNKIIIENQFGLADDSHFSRIMKYRAGLNKINMEVDTIIWIVEDADDSICEVFRDLNNNISNTNFFIVKMLAEKDFVTNALYIDYDVLVKPNIFIREMESININNSNHEKIMTKFWDYFYNNIDDNIKSTLQMSKFSTKKSQKWLKSPWNKNENIVLKIRKKNLCIEYALENPVDDLNGTGIENVFSINNDLVYKPIYLISRDDWYDIEDENNWPNIIKWFNDNLLILIANKDKIINL